MNNDLQLVPLYQQIKEKILKSLDCARWKPGEVIPSEIELSNIYGVSQGTVRKAIDELVANNILIRRQGSGTFVATHEQYQVSHRFLKIFTDGESDQKEWFLSRKYLSCEKVKAPEYIRQALQLNDEDFVYAIKRQLSFDNHVVLLDYIWIVEQKNSVNLTLDVLNSKNPLPLYGVFESLFKVRMLRADEKLKAMLLPEHIAKEMNVKVNIPVLLIKRISYTYNDKPIEFRDSFCITDNHYYKSKLN